MALYHTHCKGKTEANSSLISPTKQKLWLNFIMIRVVTLKASYHSIVYYHARFLLGLRRNFHIYILLEFKLCKLGLLFIFLLIVTRWKGLLRRCYSAHFQSSQLQSCFFHLKCQPGHNPRTHILYKRTEPPKS